MRRHFSFYSGRYWFPVNCQRIQLTAILEHNQKITERQNLVQGRNLSSNERSIVKIRVENEHNWVGNRYTTHFDFQGDYSVSSSHRCPAGVQNFYDAWILCSRLLSSEFVHGLPGNTVFFSVWRQCKFFTWNLHGFKKKNGICAMNL